MVSLSLSLFSMVSDLLACMSLGTRAIWYVTARPIFDANAMVAHNSFRLNVDQGHWPVVVPNIPFAGEVPDRNANAIGPFPFLFSLFTVSTRERGQMDCRARQSRLWHSRCARKSREVVLAQVILFGYRTSGALVCFRKGSPKVLFDRQEAKSIRVASRLMLANAISTWTDQVQARARPTALFEPMYEHRNSSQIVHKMFATVARTKRDWAFTFGRKPRFGFVQSQQEHAQS